MNKMKTGLVSVTFRRLSPKEIVVLAQKAGLSCIEWGGDVHVPAGNLAAAREVAQLTRDAGLEVAAYGSYYRLTHEEDGMVEAVVATAEALGAPLIRVWAGKHGSAEASPACRDEIVRNARSLCRLAAQKNMDVAFEYHGGTLTDTADSALSLLKSVHLPNAFTLWQPPVNLPTEECVQSIRLLWGYIRNIHVFSWNATDRLPLCAGEEKWRACLQEISQLPGERALMLEFVRGDSPEQLAADASCLQKWLNMLF